MLTQEAKEQATEQAEMVSFATRSIIEAMANDKLYQKSLAQFAWRMRQAYIEEGFNGLDAMTLVSENIRTLKG